MEYPDVDLLIEALIEREGRYVNHPDDRGGATCYGITESVARAHGYAGGMRNLPRAEAAAIYRRLYWIRPASTRSLSGARRSRPNCSIPA
jgi:lysozyme family protein